MQTLERRGAGDGGVVMLMEFALQAIPAAQLPTVVGRPSRTTQEGTYWIPPSHWYSRIDAFDSISLVLGLGFLRYRLKSKVSVQQTLWLGKRALRALLLTGMWR